MIHDPNPLSHLWWWFEIHSGTRHETGPYYGFFSGFGSDIGEVALIGAIFAGLRHINCHEPKCLRIGRHTTPEGYKLCKKHVGMSKKELNLHDIHKDHR